MTWVKVVNATDDGMDKFCILQPLPSKNVVQTSKHLASEQRYAIFVMTQKSLPQHVMDLAQRKADEQKKNKRRKQTVTLEVHGCRCGATSLPSTITADNGKEFALARRNCARIRIKFLLLLTIPYISPNSVPFAG